eukprot:3933237-Rhodomonas_salina.3
MKMLASGRRGRLLPFEVGEAQLCRTRAHLALARTADEVFCVLAAWAPRLEEVIARLCLVDCRKRPQNPLHDVHLAKEYGGAEEGVDGAGNLENVGRVSLEHVAQQVHAPVLRENHHGRTVPRVVPGGVARAELQVALVEQELEALLQDGLGAGRVVHEILVENVAQACGTGRLRLRRVSAVAIFVEEVSPRIRPALPRSCAGGGRRLRGAVVWRRGGELGDRDSAAGIGYACLAIRL